MLQRHEPPEPPVQQRPRTADLTTPAAVELGVRAASLYHHIRNKDALFDLVVNSVGVEHGRRVVAEYATVTSLERVGRRARRVALDAYDFHAEHPGVASLTRAREFRVDRDDPVKHPDAPAIALAEVDALVRSELPLAEATDVHQTCALWTLAEIVAETSQFTGNHVLGRYHFEHGHELLRIVILRCVERRAAPTIDPTDAPSRPWANDPSVASTGEPAPRNRRRPLRRSGGSPLADVPYRADRQALLANDVRALQRHFRATPRHRISGPCAVS